MTRYNAMLVGDQDGLISPLEYDWSAHGHPEHYERVVLVRESDYTTLHTQAQTLARFILNTHDYFSDFEGLGDILETARIVIGENV